MGRLNLRYALRRVFSSRVLRASSVLMIGNWVGLMIAIVTSIVLARILGPDNFGLVILALASVNVVIEFMDVRTSEALIRFMGSALARGDRDEALTFFIIGLGVDALVSAVAVAVVLLAVPPVVSGHEQGDTLRALVLIYIMAVPFALLQNTFEAVFHILKRFYLLSTINLVHHLLSLAILVVLAAQGITSLTWGYVLVAAVLFVLQGVIGVYLLVTQLRGARANGYRARWSQFWPFAFHTSAMGSLKAVAINLDILLLGALRPVSEVTFFKLARSTVSLVALPIAPISTVLYPLMNEAAARGDRARVTYLIKRLMAYSGVISLGVTLVLLVALRPLVLLVYGVEYEPVVGVVFIMMIGTLLELLFGWVRTLALIDNRPQLVTFSGVASFAGRYTLALPLIYFWGVTGSAVGHVFGIIVSVGVNLFYVLPRLGMRWYRRG